MLHLGEDEVGDAARHEAERARGERVATSRDDDAPQALQRRAAAGPVGEREERMARLALSVGRDGSLVRLG